MQPPDAPRLERLGPYLVLRRIGHGSTGAVVLARDPRTGLELAIKTLSLGSAFEPEALNEARQRFTREAQAAGRLKHRGIVTILDTGEQSGLAWIAMEHLPGRDLAQHSAEGSLLPVADVVRIAARVAEALAHAHRQGVVHRDVKPANVVVDLAADSIKLTDFGIARIGDAQRTRTGMLLGTPAYMSPEQIAGQHLDGRSDLYALGVTLFQLLCGRLPHEAESMAARLRQIAQQPAPDIRSLRPELPAALAGVVAQALEKRPESRFADGDRMAEALRASADAVPGPEPA